MRDRRCLWTPKVSITGERARQLAVRRHASPQRDMRARFECGARAASRGRSAGTNGYELACGIMRRVRFVED